MHIVVSKQDTVVQSLTLSTDVVEIGSDPDVQVYLPDGRIAPHQASLLSVEGGWVVEPVDRRHALILNAEVAEERAPIKNGAEIRLGDFALKIYIDMDEDAPPVKSAVTEEVAKLREHALPHGSVTRKEKEITLAPDARGRAADFALRLHECIDFTGLLNKSAGALLKVFDARMVWIGVRRQGYGELEFIAGERKDGKTVGDPPGLPTFRYRCLEHDQFIVVPRADERETESTLAIPLITSRGRLGMIYIDSPAGARPYGTPHLDELTMYGALIGRQLEAIVAEQVHLQEAVNSGELAFVREVQARMDPTTVPQWDELQLAVYCKPGLKRAGDVFDVMRLPNGLASFLVAHAEASSTRTALAMAEVRAAFRMAAMHADPPHIFLRALNWLLRADRDAGRLHCAAVVMNPKSGACEYATAGDIGAIVVDHSGEPRVLADPAVEALGQGQEYNRLARSERLAPKETLVFYTAGCWNVTDPNGNRLGVGPLTGALCDGFGQPAAGALDELLSDLGAFFKKGRQPDDITMLFVHRI